MVDSKPASHHSIKEQPASLPKVPASQVELSNSNGSPDEATDANAAQTPSGTSASKADVASQSKTVAASEDSPPADEPQGNDSKTTSLTAEDHAASDSPPSEPDKPDNLEKEPSADTTAADKGEQPESGATPEAEPAAKADGAPETAEEAETAPTEVTADATDTVQDGESDLPGTEEETDMWGEGEDTDMWGEGEETDMGEEGEEMTETGLTSTQGEADDVVTELQPTSPMLVPIPEPDFSDLANKEKLFPRPAISNPKVCYEMSCKQLGVVPMSQYLKSLETYAEDLKFQSYGLARLDMLPLCHSLAYNTTALTLNLSNNRLTEDILPNIQAMMNDNSFIGTINLSRNRLTGPGLASLPVMLTNNFTLTWLDLSHCQLLDADAPSLTAVIEASLNLRVFILSYNELSGCGKLFGKVLATDEGLEVLDLRWNQFWSKSAKDLLLGLRGNSRLRRLDLSWNSLGPDTAKAVRGLLKKNATLAELDLSHNRLSDGSLRIMALGLSKNATLEKIWVGHNPATPVGALAFAKSLAKMSVNYIDLSNIEVSSDFVKLKEALDPAAMTIVHGTINKDMVLIEPPKKKGARGPPPPPKKKKK